MNGADLARLELAKRAFRATEPNAREVQRGVRRARLALQRPKARRRWFSKGAVMLVLAIGGLAYAKPQALNDVIAGALATHDASTKHGLSRATGDAALTAPQQPAVAVTHERQPQAVMVPTTEQAPVLVTEPAKAVAVSERARSVTPPKPASAPRLASSTGMAREAAGAALTAGAEARAYASTEAPATAVSDWGRVAQALAQGDESEALSALSTLSESGDQSTRDKADIGRAQLFMANGDHEGACALARDLIRRNAGGRIDRQAQAILKSCSR